MYSGNPFNVYTVKTKEYVKTRFCDHSIFEMGQGKESHLEAERSNCDTALLATVNLLPGKSSVTKDFTVKYCNFASKIDN